MPGQSFRGFAERVALVTNGSRGTGRAVALQLALEGAYVIVNYAPGEAEGERAVSELRKIGTLAHSIEADVSRAEEVRRMFGIIEEMYGRLDLLVNNAHANRDAQLDSLTEEAWDEVLNFSLKGTFLCSQAAARLMRKRPSPAVVNIASEIALTGRAGGANYAAAQAGIIGLTKSLARELAPRIRVNCVAVRGSETGREPARGGGGESGGPEKHPRDKPEGVSGGHTFAAPDDVARACVYLLSSDAKLITGQTLVVGSV